jgi:hypothetical protein
MDNTQLFRKPRILIYDIECSPELSWTYPPEWQTSVIRMEDRQKLMSFSYKWYGENKIYHRSLADMPTFDTDHQDDSLLARELHDVMEAADIVMGHNNFSFDNKMANMFFVVNGIEPIPPYKVIDTKRMATSLFKFPSNKLDNLARLFSIKGKTETTIGSLWYKCYVEKDKKAYELLKDYNNQDVIVTEQLYEKMRPFMHQHPSLSRISGEYDSCPRCGGYSFRIKAYRTTNTARYHQYQCNECLGYFSDRKSITEKEGDIKPSYVNV